MLATKTRYTFADLLDQAPDDYNIYDVLGGELVVWSSPNTAHGATVTQLFGLLYAAQEAGHGLVLTAPCAVAFDYGERGLGAEEVTHPDLLLVSTARRHIVGERCLMAAPDLVIEVLSPTTRPNPARQRQPGACPVLDARPHAEPLTPHLHSSSSR